MKADILKNKFVAAVGAILCCGLWGISTPIVKMGYAHTDPSHVPSLLLWLGLQFVAAGILTVGAGSLINKRFLLPKRKSLKGILLIGLLQTVIQYCLMYVGLLYTTSVKGAILKSTDVFFVALLSSLVFRMEKLTVKKAAACIIGFLGIVVMNLDGLSLNFNWGDGAIALGIFAYSVGVMVTKIFAQDEQPIAISGYQMTFGGAVMLLLGACLGGKIDFVGMLPVFGCLAVIYAVSYTLWTMLLKYNSASGITIYSFMTPVLGVIFSALLLEEDSGVDPVMLIVALALVCFGILLWGYEGKKRKAL